MPLQWVPRTSTRPNPAPSRWRTHRPPSPLCLLPAPTTTQHRPALPFYTARTKPSIKCSVSGLWSNPCPPKPHVGPPSLPGLTTRPKHAPERHKRTWTNEPVQPRMAGAQACGAEENGEGGEVTSEATSGCGQWWTNEGGRVNENESGGREGVNSEREWANESG